MAKPAYQYDVFISHAVEDKILIANALSESLEAKGLTVWYSGRELSVGDKLIDTIHEGLNQCRFGVVVISPTYLSKIWALHEFFNFLEREKRDGSKVILPVLHDITPEELAAKFPIMADIFAVRAERGVEFVSERLFNEIQNYKNTERKALPLWPLPKRLIQVLALVSLVALAAVFIFKYVHTRPSDVFIRQLIQKRIKDLQGKADLDLQQFIRMENGKIATDESIKKIYSDYQNARSYYRNEYVLKTGYEVIRSKKNVETALAINMENLSPFNTFSFSAPEIYKCVSSARIYREEKYVFYNTQPVAYSIEGSEGYGYGDDYSVKIIYTSPIRLIYTTLAFPSSPSDTKRYQMVITAFRPMEKYSFAYENKTWQLKRIE